MGISSTSRANALSVTANWLTNKPLPQDAITVINALTTIKSSPSSAIGPGSLNHLLQQKKTSPEEIVDKLNHEFSLKPEDPGSALNTILNEFKEGNHVHRANFNAFLSYLDNGITNNHKPAMELALNLCRGFEVKENGMEDEHSKKLLSTLTNNKLRSKMGPFPKIKKVVKENIFYQRAIYELREVKVAEIKEMLANFSPQSKNWDATPYHFNYKNGLNIESYHFRDENGKVIEATLIVSQDKKNRINIDNAKKVIGALYQGDRAVEVSEVEIPYEKWVEQDHVVILFDRTNLVNLEQYMGDQDKQNTPWTLDSAAVTYGNKKKKFIDTLNTLNKTHEGLKELHKDKEFAFPSYGFLNPHNILSDQSGAETFFNPATLLIRDIFKKQHMHENGDAEMHAVQDPIFDKKFLSSTVRLFRATQRASEDLYSMAMIWEKTFNLDMQKYTNGPYNEALHACMNPGSRKTCDQLQEEFSEDAVYTVDDLKRLCSGRAGENELIKHVEDCLENPQTCKASRKLILETAAILLLQKKDSFAESAKAWSKLSQEQA